MKSFILIVVLIQTGFGTVNIQSIETIEFSSLYNCQENAESFYELNNNEHLMTSVIVDCVEK